MCSCFFFVIFVSFRIGLILGFPLSIGTIDLSLFAGEGGEGGREGGRREGGKGGGRGGGGKGGGGRGEGGGEGGKEGGKGGGREGGEETFRSVSCQMMTLSL